jgi:Outer membrane protein beta-barrel domain
MRRIYITALALCISGFLFAQNDTLIANKVLKPQSTRANDNFMLQLGYTMWNDIPDSIRTKGFSRTFNMYLMLDFPFKSNPKWSVAIGPGIATDNVFFDKMTLDIKGQSENLVFADVSDTTHFRKYKLATAYLEAPVELRWRSNPSDDRKSVKIALGAKIGTLVNAHVKGKELQNSSDNTINDYTMKENSKRYFNKTRFSVMGRVGYSNFTIFATYAITPVFREGVAPTVRPFTIGLSLSGL